MYTFCKLRAIPIHGNLLTSAARVRNEIAELCTGLTKNHVLVDINPNHTKSFKTLKLTPCKTPSSYQPKLIEDTPLEITEGDYTYRFITAKKPGYVGNYIISIICRNDDKMYDYLDKGFYVHTVEQKVGFKKTYRHIVANEYDVNVAHIFAMCTVDPKLADMLQHGCFINVHTAEITRLRMAKKMNDGGKKKESFPTHIHDAIEEDYRQNSTLQVVGKLVAGEIEKTTINNIVFTKSSALYDQISIEAEDLLDVLYKELNFNGEFDIYSITAIYAAHMEKSLNKRSPETEATKDAEDTLEEEVQAAGADSLVLPEVKINGIPINATLTDTFQRRINKVRINKDELAKAISRASCYHNADDYKLFLKSISRMSIKYHDIISNGLPVKIHSTISREEYHKAEPTESAPALKLCIDPVDKYFKLQVDKDRMVRVNLGRLIKKVETLNRKTNNKSYLETVPGYFYKRSSVRNYNWCAQELVAVLIDCCTFQKTQKKEDGTDETVPDVLISNEDILKLMDMANEQKRKILERSKEFLATAVKLTDAKLIEFLGECAYHVKGTLREYAVVIKNAKVYDYATKQYRCIVNDRHYAGAGYDDIAARLLALKNDSTTQAHINTLKGAAQPGAENVHNDYVPERDVTDGLVEVINKIYTNKVENNA